MTDLDAEATKRKSMMTVDAANASEEEKVFFAKIMLLGKEALAKLGGIVSKAADESKAIVALGKLKDDL